MQNVQFPWLNQTVEPPETPNLNLVFHALSDPTRRRILGQLGKISVSITDIVYEFKLSFSAAGKHIGVLERAGLIRKYRRGKRYMISLEIHSLRAAERYLNTFVAKWDERRQSFKRNMEKMR